ncbi:transcription antitermination factor NusB [Tepidimicrobium xylanilyticum]|uniref:Transcription antitermination protein NusB n=1 Tax=Tepidimicrobium xylanilyticum TaxID=1123352 RepID=A0A1H3CRE1_9FIRM|nr:transcription antitermination factor NusB [Tepidimicrobium xylanilyticum]GMG97719.1 N utilization substance protein B [Tepidimicrobium xylanilyticum]SDX56802.1 NusB antitermination factor [Tepidimicrobium xylanilyticum]
MGRRYARESTMKLLYQMEINSDFSNYMIDTFFEYNKFNPNEKEYIEKAISTIVENLDIIDHHIEENLEGWELHRLAKIDLCILRIAIYEIIYREDIPIEVSINEAIEIGRTYSTFESSKFINGVLGGFVRRRDEDGE